MLLLLSVQYHKDSGNHEQTVLLELFRGTLTSVIAKARQNDRLDDWLVALSPLATTGQWHELAQAYAKQLANDKHCHKAVSYLLAANKVHFSVIVLILNIIWVCS